MKKLIIARRISQLTNLLLFVYVLWSTTYPLEGRFPPKVIFQIDPLIMIFISISERVILPGLLFILPFFLLTLIVGRFYCGWICPLGTIIDGVGSLTKTARSHILRDATSAKIRKFKYYILGLIAVSSILGLQIAWIFDPLVIAARFISLNMIPAVTLIINKLFEFFIKNFNLYGGFYDFYRGFKESFLGVKTFYFSNTAFILLFFLLIVFAGLFLNRAWCRTACPLGAIYGIISKFSLMKRFVGGCTHCRKCKSVCRMGAIKDDSTYVNSECILCMDCVYGCLENSTSFAFSFKTGKTIDPKKAGTDSGITRREFLLFSFSSMFLAGIGLRNISKRLFGKNVIKSHLIRPPGAQDEEGLIDRCIRCGNCMKVCPTNVLQPAMLEEGIVGLWTPRLVNEIGYCEYNCTLCGEVCPTGAIPKLPLDVKQSKKLGIAEVNRDICIAWAEDKECIVCQEHCPIPEKAIKLEVEIVAGKKIYRPIVDSSLCIGCGVCQNKCPVRPVRAIQILPCVY